MRGGESLGLDAEPASLLGSAAANLADRGRSIHDLIARYLEDAGWRLRDQRRCASWRPHYARPPAPPERCAPAGAHPSTALRARAGHRGERHRRSCRADRPIPRCFMWMRRRWSKRSSSRRCSLWPPRMWGTRSSLLQGAATENGWSRPTASIRRDRLVRAPGTVCFAGCPIRWW